jgi:acyl-CoA synthetase (AMP-forming)/AMP-acid ligase II
MMTIDQLLVGNVRRIPDREALVFGSERLTWRQLNSIVNRLADGLARHGVKPGDRVAFVLPNGIEIVALYYAIAKLGATSVPIMPRSVSREIKHIVSDVSATAVIAAADQAEQVTEALTDLSSVIAAIGVGDEHGLPLDFRALIADGEDTEPGIVVDPDAVYAIQFTSGTTGAPKGCMLPHRQKVLSRISMLSYVPYTQEDRALLFMPLAASLGADMLHTHTLCGAATVLVGGFDPAEMLHLIEAEQITLLYALESTFDRLIGHDDVDSIDWGSLRLFFATSATRDLRPGVARLKALRNFHAELWNGYGSSEGGGWLTFTSPQDIESGDEDAQRSVGRECMLARVDCVDDNGDPLPPGEIGEMTLSAPWLFSGYWGAPEKTAEALRDGRYFTGDLARKDETGRIFLEGRKTDMIKTGGLNVYPAEVEMVIAAFPNVAEVAVVGIADEQWGEKVIACVIVDGALDQEELLGYCKQQLAGYKVPKEVAVLTDFPRGPTGKILKRELRELVLAD